MCKDRNKVNGGSVMKYLRSEINSEKHHYDINKNDNHIFLNAKHSDEISKAQSLLIVSCLTNNEVSNIVNDKNKYYDAIISTKNIINKSIDKGFDEKSVLTTALNRCAIEIHKTNDSVEDPLLVANDPDTKNKLFDEYGYGLVSSNNLDNNNFSNFVESLNNLITNSHNIEEEQKTFVKSSIIASSSRAFFIHSCLHVNETNCDNEGFVTLEENKRNGSLGIVNTLSNFLPNQSIQENSSLTLEINNRFKNSINSVIENDCQSIEKPSITERSRSFIQGKKNNFTSAFVASKLELFNLR